MKITPLKLLTCICLMQIAAGARAQKYPDYVITTKGDSINCKITARFIGGDLYYKSNSTDKAEKLTPDAIKEFFDADEKKLYRAVPVGNNTVLYLTVLEKGKINLFERIETYHSQYSGGTVTVWSAGKGSDSVKEIKFNALSLGKSLKERKDELAKMLMDDKNVYEIYR